MKKNEAKPSIRFKDFNYKWSAKELDKVVNSFGGTSLEEYFNTTGKYKVISIGSFNENNNYNDQNLRIDLNEKSKNFILNKDDLAMILNDKTQSCNILGRVLLIPEDNKFIYNQRTQRIVLNKLFLNPLFTYFYLNSKGREGIIKNAQGNTQVYINWSAVSNLKIIFPTLEEQKKISELLKNFSLTHAQLKRKLNLIKTYKNRS
ncbi:restriction endonuclease subunit S [Mycoplasma sp. 1654_15]|uniref:restriction endonuclease subunit S n=1 Tax=Mycoplasma sp. 1654_15 TaxID=2725994 RepID=UPI001448B5E7|nr:restriction endonuclease subunit S [Mycoplasma sp. 1654_15]